MKSSDKLVAVLNSGYGHWKIKFKHYSDVKVATITDSEAVDRYREVKDNRDRGYEAACSRLLQVARRAYLTNR